jgi:AraC family transcriptional regulator, regulatory protein of adaptative response / methylated-DNA-[protein]-cysteine methyltransferase
MRLIERIKDSLMWYRFCDSSLGRLAIAGTEAGISAIRIGGDDAFLLEELRLMFHDAVPREGGPEVDALTAEAARAIEDAMIAHALPLDLRGSTFQHKVWEALQRIPAGETVTYSELAHRIGAESAVRAVANACGANPVAVVIPCHRVVRADGGLSGYRWGLERKQQLLAQEAGAL